MDCIYRHNNIYRNIILFFSIIFIIISCKNDVGLLIVVPNNYIGEFYIIEDKKKYQEPDIKAFENFGVYEYRLNGNEIKV
ncbi:MAG: hypothetical protein LBV17_05735, partial [Treponema sp.]|nr:hypothetical protein [Treponema sp.]